MRDTLTPAQLARMEEDIIRRGMRLTARTLEQLDGKSRHYALFLFTHESYDAVTSVDETSTSVLTSVPTDILHELLLEWMRGRTQ